MIGTVPARANLVIVPTWDSTITSDPAYSAITNTIMQAIAVYAGTFSNNITVTITFETMSGGLGESEYYTIPAIPYSTYRSALSSSASTLYDHTALAHLPNTSTNPVNGSSTVYMTLANVRALGYTNKSTGFNGYSVYPPSGKTDGIVLLNTSIMNFTRPPTNSSDYDLFAVASHEMDEILGIGSALTDLNNGDPAPTGDVSVLDLFRYDQNGNHSFNTAEASEAFFSIDGVTKLVQFNQYEGGDFNDWYSYPYGGNPPRVQDAFATPGAAPNLDVELIALDVIGYNLIIPKMALTKISANTERISWSPTVPGFILQESTNLASTNWLNSASGTNNPVTITNTAAVKLYRLGHD